MEHQAAPGLSVLRPPHFGCAVAEYCVGWSYAQSESIRGGVPIPIADYPFPRACVARFPQRPRAWLRAKGMCDRIELP